jgi:hypothetical protein
MTGNCHHSQSIFSPCTSHRVLTNDANINQSSHPALFCTLTLTHSLAAKNNTLSGPNRHAKNNTYFGFVIGST